MAVRLQHDRLTHLMAPLLDLANHSRRPNASIQLSWDKSKWVWVPGFQIKVGVGPRVSNQSGCGSLGFKSKWVWVPGLQIKVGYT